MKREEYLEREKIYACWLCNFPNVGDRQLHRLVQLCGSMETVYKADKNTWGQVLSPRQVESFTEYTRLWPPEDKYRSMVQQGIRLITFGDPEYPERLREIPDPPFGLFLRGELPSRQAPGVAVIGARDCSEYGKYVAGQLGETLGRNGIVVISGMARGIDGCSQEAALAAGGSSVAVLGSGVDICYPASSRGLYERLSRQGAVISSYPLGTPARSRNFPPRNRIVSGLADAVVVVEARVKSGTLITVDMALEQGREVYVVPGRITDRLSDGCNRLLRQGAGVLLSPEELIKELWELWERKKGPESAHGHGKPAAGQKAERIRSSLRSIKADAGDCFSSEAGCSPMTPSVPPALMAVYGALDFQPRTTEQIRSSLPEDYPERQLIPALMELCMEGVALQVSSGHFCRSGEKSR